MFNSISTRAIGLLAKQAVGSAADAFRRGLSVLMLLVTASVMLNLATPNAARADVLPPAVTASFSSNTIQAGETTTLTMVLVNDAGFPLKYFFYDTAASFADFLPSGVVLGPNAVTANACGFDITAHVGGGSPTAGASAFVVSKMEPGITAGATCTVSFEITAATAGSYSFDDYELYVVMDDGADFYVPIASPGTLTVTAAPLPDPTPTLTFDNEVTSALVGTDFSLAATSTVNGPGAGAITYSTSDSNVAAVAPETGYVAAVGVGEVTITAFQAAAPGVNAEATATMTFTVEPRTPTVTALSVTSGPQIGGTTVVLTGTNLDVITDVYFGANVVSVVTVNSATEIVVTSPAGAEGAVNVTVVTPYGTSASEAGNLFTYDPLPPPPPAPTITGLSPSSGSTAGGTIVEITGTGFSVGYGHLDFGIPDWTPYEIISDTLIRAETLPGSAGLVDVTLTTDNGTSATNPGAQFTYITPVDPTPVLTFDNPTSASVAYGGSLTNAATSTITGGGAGAITYGSSDEAVATVNETTGAITTIGVGAATITATQAASGGVNTLATQTYALTVAAPAAPTIAVSTTSYPSTIAVGGTTQLTFTLTNPNAVGITGVAVSLTLPSGLVINQAFGGQFVNNCTNGSLSGTTGGASVSLTGARINASSSCTFTVVVRGTSAGSTVLTTGAPSATGSGAGDAGTLALTVNPALTTTQAVPSTELTQNVAATAFTPVTASGGAGTLSYNLSGGSLPSGLSFSSSTGQITGTPAGLLSATTYTVTVTDASVPTALTSSKTFDLSVIAAPDPTPVLSFDLPAFSLPHGDGLLSAATSTISTGGAGEITYSSSNTNVATVDEEGGVTTVAVGTTTITATQAAAAGVNAEATTTYALTVTVGTGSYSDATLSASTVVVGDTVDLTITVSNYSGVDVVTGDGAAVSASLVNGFATYGAGPLSNSCGGAQTADNNYLKTQSGLAVANGATCTIVYRLTATGASASPDSITVGLTRGTSNLNDASYTMPLTVTPPVPVLTFTTPTAASVNLGSVLNNAATSTITGGSAGAITYASSDTNVATVGATTGTISPIATGTATITATQAGNATVNAVGTQTYVLTVAALTPTVTALSPSNGIVAGGTLVQLTGTNFIGITAVKFGETNALFFIPISETRVMALSPAGVGEVNVTVTTPGGTSAVGAANLYTYIPIPVLTFATPTAASVAMGGSLTNVATSNISGGGAGAITYSSSHEGVATVDANTGAITPVEAGFVTITATQAAGAGVNGVGTQTYQLTVTPPTPTLTFATPTAASVVLGGSLTNAATSNVSGDGAGGITYASSDTGVATVDPQTGVITPVAAGTATITATQASSGVVNLVGTQTYLLTVTAPLVDPTPTLSFTNPATSLFVGWSNSGNGATSTINGPGSGAITYVSSDPAVVSVDAVTGVPTGVSAGTVTITATQAAAAGVNAQGTASYNLEVKGTPAVTSITPTSVSTAGGETIVIRGTYLSNVTGLYTVDLGGSQVLPFNLVSDSELNFVTPAAPAGGGSVRLVFGGGQVVAGMFTYVTPAPTPTVTAISPTSGPAAGGTSVVITGTDFTGVTEVRFGSTPVSAVYLNGDTEMTVVSPSGAGAVNVTVTTLSGTSATSAATLFTYVPTPVLTFATPTSASVAFGGALTNAATSSITGVGAGEITYNSSDTHVATVDYDTGAITPVALGTATITATQSAAAGVNAQATASYALTVSLPALPVISTTYLKGWTVLHPGYSDAIAATGAGQLTFAVATGSFPMGLTLDPGTGAISGTPVSGGAYAFTVTVTDGAGQTTTASLSILINSTITAGPTSLPEGVVGTLYSQELPASDGTGALTRTLTGDLPAGVSFNDAYDEDVPANLYGTPTASGVFPLTYTVTDSVGATVSASLSLVINTPAPPPAPTITSLERTSGIDLGGSRFEIYGTGFTADSTVTFDGLAATVTFVGAGTLSVVTPTHAVGDVDVLVTEDGQASNAAAYYYLPAPNASVRQVFVMQPTSGAETISIPVALDRTSSDPVEVTVRTVDGTALDGQHYTGRQETITFLPGEELKTFEVEILSIATYGPSLAFTVEISTASGATVDEGRADIALDNPNPAPIPVVSSVSPDTGPTAGGTSVVLTGTNLGGVIVIAFGDTIVTEFTIDSPTQITVISPSRPAGLVNILVGTNSAASEPGTGNAFTYADPIPDPDPELTFATPDSAAVTLGQTLTNVATSTINGAGAGAITYASDDTAIATVDGTTGVVTPVSEGTTIITATQAAAEGVNTEATASYELTVTEPVPPVINGRSLPAWTQGGPEYTETLVATGGAAPLAFAINGGALPVGLALNATTGVISGLPTEAGDFGFSVQVTDGLGRTAQDRFDITINPRITVTPETIEGGVLGQAYSQAFEASGGTGSREFGFKGGLPDGVTFNPETAVLSGTPTETGTFEFMIIAGDDTDSYGGRHYSLVIEAGGPTAGPVTLDVAYGSADNPVMLDLGGPPTISATVGTGPSHGLVVVDGLTVTYTPTPGYYGPDSFTYIAIGENGESEPATVTVTVGLPPAPVAGDDTATTPFATPVAITLQVQGVFTSLSVATPPAHGAVVISGTTATYTPAVEFFGEDQFSFTATGPGGVSAPALVSLLVRDPVIEITPDSLPSATQGEAYSTPLSASGGIGPYRFRVSSGELPAGLSLSSRGGISGTPTVYGTFDFTVQVANAGVGRILPASEKSYTLTVDAPAAPPPPEAEAVAVSVSVTSEEEGGSTPIDLSSSVSNATGIIIVTMPLHGTVKINGFIVTYTPDAGYHGPDSFTYRAVGLPGSASAGDLAAAAMPGSPLYCVKSNAPGMSALATVSITVLSPTLTLSPSATPSAMVGSAFSQQFTADGGAAPYHDFRVEAGALPAGLTLSASGLLTGTPTAGGTFGFTIAATDSSTGAGPFDASRAYSLTVNAPTLSLIPGTVAAGLQGEAYGPVSFAGQGGTAPYSFSLASGSLPAGMTLSSAGLLSGTPSESGHYSFTVRTTDASTGSGPFNNELALTLDIGVPAAPTATATTLAAPYNSPGVDLDVTALVGGAYSSVALAAGPAHGTVVRSGNQFTYTPTAGYYGADSFSFTAAGLGGTSAPAVVSVTVATPAPITTPKSATTTANAPVDIAVTTGDSGPISSIAVSQQPSHGTLAVNGLSVTYTPTTNYFGPDSFSYTATGAGGTSAPAVVSLTVSPLPVPTSAARTASVLAGQSVVFDASAGATGGPFTAVALVGSPAFGTATVSGQQITYAAPVGFSGTTSFTYALSNPFGTSAPITASITVNPLPAPGAPITVIVPADGSGSAVLTTNATGGPFQSAAIISLSPAGSGTMAITQGSGPSGPTFTLTFTAATHFSGSATVSYSLTNAFATSAPGTVVFQVQPRPDPTLDPDVRSLVAAQTDTTLRFATAQIGNFNRRLESLRNGPGQSDLDGVSLNFGDLFYRGDQSDPFALRDRQLGRQDADVALWGARPTSPTEAAGGFKAAGDGGSAGDGAGGVSVWTGGTIDLGLRRGKAGLSKLDFTTQGVSLGADFSVNDRFVIGGGTGYSRDSTTIGTSGSRSKATSHVGVIYGAYHPSEKTYLEMVLGYGEMSFESKRIVPLTGLAAYGERDGSQLFASVTAAFEQRNGPLTWTPYGRVAVISAELDAFTETGGGLGALTFNRQTIRSVKGVAGLTSDYTTRTRYGLLTPALRLEYDYEFEDGGTYSIGYADWVGGPIFSAPTDTLGRGRLTIGIGADLQRGPLLLGIEYRGAMGSDEATSNQLSATARMRF